MLRFIVISLILTMAPAAHRDSAHSAMMPARASSPSVSAAGPGCRISGDLISRRKPSRTAGMAPAPGRRDLGRNELLAAPGADDDVGSRRDQLGQRYDALPGVLAPRQRGKHLDAAGDLDQLRHPADAGDHRLVPFLEVDAWTPCERRGARACLVEALLQRARERIGLAAHADQRAERADHVEDAGD